MPGVILTPWLTPQWSPGLMAGGSQYLDTSVSPGVAPQWSPGLMAGGRLPRPALRSPQTRRRNGAPA